MPELSVKVKEENMNINGEEILVKTYRMLSICPKCGANYSLGWQDDSSIDGGFETVECSECFRNPEIGVEMTDDEYDTLLAWVIEHSED